MQRTTSTETTQKNGENQNQSQLQPEFEPKKSKTWPWIVVAVLVTILIISPLIYYITDRHSNVGYEDRQTLEKKTENNSAEFLGFSFQYPKEWGGYEIKIERSGESISFENNPYVLEYPEYNNIFRIYTYSNFSNYEDVEKFCANPEGQPVLYCKVDDGCTKKIDGPGLFMGSYMGSFIQSFIIKTNDDNNSYLIFEQNLQLLRKYFDDDFVKYCEPVFQEGILQPKCNQESEFGLTYEEVFKNLSLDYKNKILNATFENEEINKAIRQFNGVINSIKKIN
ncbi:MAG: hypothetical protein ABIA02_03435 [Candidatus Falkowbacteria bacterium]